MARTVGAEQELLSIGEVAEQAGVQTSAIRYYEQIGLLPRAERRSGQRRFRAEVLTLLSLIRVSKEAGFTLEEIKLLTDGFGDDVSPSQRWRALAESKLAEIDSLAARLDAMRSVLRRGLECGCLRLEDCELLAAVRSERS